MNWLLQDLRYGIRVLWKSPGFSLVAIMALALGIGANTAIFSVVNAVILRPLAYPQPDKLVRFLSTIPDKGIVDSDFSYLNFTDIRSRNTTFAAISAFEPVDAAMTGDENSEQINGIESSWEFFTVLGSKPMIGRTFSAEDELSGNSRVVVLSNAIWTSRFGGDARIVGKTVTLDGEPKTVIGVMPSEFRFPFQNTQPQFWIPLDPKGEMESRRGNKYLDVLGRLKDTTTIQAGQSDVRGIAAQLAREYPNPNTGSSINLETAQHYLIGDVRPTLLVLLAAVGLVLLIACANVANLLLARATGRSREIALRAALGANRWRIVRQLLTESLVLSICGGGSGLLLALWGTDLLSSLVPENIPRIAETGVDATVLSFTVGISILTGVLFGMAPAIQTSRVNLNESLKEGGRSATSGRSRNHLRNILISVEVALSVVLLVGAGLLIKSFFSLRHTNPGIDARGVLTASVSLPSVRYAKEEQQIAYFDDVIKRTSTSAGVESVAGITPLPLGGDNIDTTFVIVGQPDPGPGQSPVSSARIVTPGYFRTMGIPLREGRDFSDQDRKNSPNAIIVNQLFASTFFPGQNAVGKRLGHLIGRIDGEIVGVVGDVRHERLSTPPVPEYYVSFDQVPVNSLSIVVKTSTADPNMITGTLRDIVQHDDKDLPVFKVQTMATLVARSITQQRFSMALLVLLAALALSLALVGIFSVMSYLVAQRTHEFGVRMALGARTKDILGLVIKQGMTYVFIGVTIGVFISIAVTRVMATMLFGVGTRDPITLVSVSILLCLSAILACILPAIRATRVDPMVALRWE